MELFRNNRSRRRIPWPRGNASRRPTFVVCIFISEEYFAIVSDIALWRLMERRESADARSNGNAFVAISSLVASY